VKQKIPEGGGRFNMEKNDGYNLLDRYERLTLANNIYSRLLTMKYKMDAMVMMCQYCGWSDAFFAWILRAGLHISPVLTWLPDSSTTGMI
jgi:hypothetical protein